MRKRALVFLCIAVVAISIPALAKTAFSGTYTVTGTNPGAGSYEGTLTISPRGEVYDVYWSIAGTSYGGVGIANGDTLSVAYTGADKTWFGVATYRQRADGSLDGKWAVAGGATKLGTETAVRK